MSYRITAILMTLLCLLLSFPFMARSQNSDQSEVLKAFAADIVKFQKQQRYMQVMLSKEISQMLVKEGRFEGDLPNWLAGQIVNYYSGFDIEEQFRDMQDPMKTQVAKIRQWILPTAEDLLKANYNLRRLVVYTLRVDTVYKVARLGQKYLDSNEWGRKESILGRFGGEFPQEASRELFDKIFLDYFRDRHKAYFGSSPRTVDDILKVFN